MRGATKRLTMQEGRHRFSVAHLLVAIVAMFIVLPIADRIAYGHLIESIAFTVLMLAAVNAVGGRRNALVAAGLLAAPAILAHWLHHIWPGVPIDLSLIATRWGCSTALQAERRLLDRQRDLTRHR